jgi:hypothetical protein
MTPAELTAFRLDISARYVVLAGQANSLPNAATDVQSEDEISDALAEALFIRAFIRYESALETLFFHYASGGGSVQGAIANSYLRPGNEEAARRMVRAGFKFMSWSKPEIIRDTAKVYIENGWPIADMMAGQNQDLADCERIRNRIAHNSAEAATQFNIVQRNLLGTERVFALTPGQLLRMRFRNSAALNLERYLKVMADVLDAITDPVP